MDNVDDIVLTPYETLEVGLHYDFPGTIDYLVEKSADAADMLRRAVSNAYTKSSVGIYWHPVKEKVAFFLNDEKHPEDLDTCFSVLNEKVGQTVLQSDPLTADDLAEDWWVKVAYSPTVRRLGEILQFFPSDKIPGFGGRPIASTIASGLLGAGLGYGGGALLDKMTPEKVKGKKGRLKNWGAALGALAGGAVGATPGFVNLMDNRSFNDNTLWNQPRTDRFDTDDLKLRAPASKYVEAIDSYVSKLSEKHASDFATIGGPSYGEMPNVNTNRLGQVLWDTYAGPQTTAMTMGAMYGANQMPDPRSRPGVVTPHQTGLFGMAMGAAGGGIKGYATGWAVGKGLGILTGMPQGTQDKLKQTGAVLGVVNSLVPRLFN